MISRKKNFFFRRSPIKYNTSNVNSDGDPIYKEAINKGFRSPRITAINDKPFIAGGVECEGYNFIFLIICSHIIFLSSIFFPEVHLKYKSVKEQTKCIDSLLPMKTLMTYMLGENG